MPERKIGIILQARMGSSRLPGKVLRPLAGKPMIQWVIERLQASHRKQLLILATSLSDQEIPLVALAEKLKVKVFRGSEFDVLDRYYQCALTYGVDPIVRATGDNPFVDPEACDELIEFFRQNELDYASVSTDAEEGYPLGAGVEIFSFDALKRSWEEGHAPRHREHVNEYILENPALFRQEKIEAPPPKRAPELSLTVDTPEQFLIAERIYQDYLNQHPFFWVPLSRAIEALRKVTEAI